MNKKLVGWLSCALFFAIVGSSTIAGPSDQDAAERIAAAVEELQDIPVAVNELLRAMWAAPEGSQERQRLAVTVCRLAKGSTRAVPVWVNGDLVCRVPEGPRKVWL